ncbi:cilium assembly protein DZIP1L [Dendroctonus ponderosae]|uniref:cilium assembly protein DZIP1L n=1 Tax=Dendroctonus ponderosae TaxID=77166 RepID=UPI002034C2F3|nr:cilium assembly protein DZIP1L [Dendroctonus ponderosae]
MWFEDYKWHYDYVRLAWDTGFAFEKCKSASLDKNKICVVDVDRIVRERDVGSVDHHISTVVQYILDEEQAKVLDTNFVKIFRISQLAVEYLLFCKKYLDNTVVLLKKELVKNREETKELKLLADDLQGHVDTLTRQQIYATFKCNSCAKIFSSEDHLNAHIKRRHSGNDHYNSETEKLNMEIKELKERLNNTEKLFKDKEQESPKKTEPNNDVKKMSEVLEKFEKFKNQVDEELKELRMQKAIYEENYGKLFEIAIQNKENLEPKNTPQEIPKMEITTQTDKQLQIEHVNYKNITEIRAVSPHQSRSVDANLAEPASNDQPKNESLDSRISTTLAGIEDQMQAFWGKLNEIERHKTSPQKQPSAQSGDSTLIKPKAKPRSKLSQPTHISGSTNNNADKLKTAIGELEQLQQESEVKWVEVKKSPVKNIDALKTVLVDPQFLERPDSSQSSNSEGNKTYSVSEESDTEEESEPPIQKTTVLVKKAANKNQRLSPSRKVFKSPTKKTAIETKIAVASEVTAARPQTSRVRETNLTKSDEFIRNDLEIQLVDRLHELGISESWNRLPQRSFDKALEIINHQAALSKKMHPNFNSTKKKIIKELEKTCSRRKLESESPKLEALQNIVKVSYRIKSNRKQTDSNKGNLGASKRKPLEIKNRSLYETDTESEPRQPIASKTSEVLARYSTVVAEIKSLSNIRSSTEDSLDNINKDHQKGALKSFPSAGSLSKKKVLFDLEEDSSKIDDGEPAILKAGGSTTSIASSILEDKNEIQQENSGNVQKELDDVSDSDLSELSN